MTYVKEMWVLGHLDWYTHVVGEGYKPTDKAPPEAVEALQKVNAYIDRAYGKVESR